MKKLTLKITFIISLFCLVQTQAQNWTPIGAIDANHPFPFKDGSVYFTTELDNNGLLYSVHPNFNKDAETMVVKTFNEVTGLWEKLDAEPYTQNRGRDYIIQFDSNNTMYVGFIGQVDTDYERAVVVKYNGNAFELVGQANITGKKVNKLRFKIADDDTMMIAAISTNYVWNNQSLNSGTINTYKFDGTNWVEQGQEIDMGYTNTYFLDLEFNGNNEVFLGHTLSTDSRTYFKKLNSQNTWDDYVSTVDISGATDFLFANVFNEEIEDLVVISNYFNQAKVWLDSEGFVEFPSITTETMSYLNEIKKDINGELVIMGIEFSNWDQRMGFVKRFDANTAKWDYVGPGVPLVNGFSYTSLLFDAQNNPTIGYYEQIGVSRKLNTENNTWDYLGSPGILEIPAWSIELAAAYDANDDLWVLMSERNKGALLTKYNTATNNWEEVARFKENSDIRTVKLIINPQDNSQYIALISRDITNYTESISVFRNNGTDWTEMGTNTVLETEFDEPDKLTFKLDKQNNPIIAYWDDDNSEYIKIRKLNNEAWETIGNFNFLDEFGDSLEIEEEYRLAIDNEGIPFLVLMHDDYDKIKLFKHNIGTNWTELDISTLSDSSEIFGLEITTDNTIYLAYEDDVANAPLVVSFTETVEEITSLDNNYTSNEIWGDFRLYLGGDDIPFVSYLDLVDYNTSRPQFQIQKHNTENDTWDTLDTTPLANAYWNNYELAFNATNKLGLVFDHGFVYAKGFQAPYIVPDADGDGVGDDTDQCDTTPETETADENGCAPSQKDADNDGVNDAIDECDDTPETENADENGCAPSQKDADNDGVNDAIDECDDTPETENADENGCALSQKDADNDGVNDAIDKCDDTPETENADENGCAPSQKDADNDGVNDAIDECDDTPETETADENGCAPSQKDADNDGVNDAIDDCDDTPETETADENGCAPSQKDADNDGVNDAIDECDDTPETENADENGCAPSQKDADSDGVNDTIDECNDTPSGTIVNEQGCTLLQPAATGFTPNGDGINDSWVIPGIENFPNNVVRVFNRWGNEVFSVKSYQNNWEGFYKNNNEKLPSGQYMYIIELGNGAKPIQGWIFLNY